MSEVVSAGSFAAASADERAEAITELSGLLSAVQAVLGSVVVAADRAGDWAEDGALDLPSWLVARCGLTRSHAREWARVAAALESLPAVRSAFASGVLSWDQVRPATRFVTPETDAEWAGRLPGLSAGQVERLARVARPVPDDDTRSAHARRCFGWRPDPKAGGYQYRGFLPADMGATVNALLLGIAEAAGPAPETGQWEPLPARCADALHGLCDQSVSVEVDIAVPVSTTAALVAGDDSGASLVAHHIPASQRSVLRYLCDGTVEHTIVGPDGTAIGVGRRCRTIPRWLRRRLVDRDDGCCRFPGCHRPIRQLHHIVHWAHGGPTDSTNLLGLCWAHHHLVHDQAWTITGNPNGTLTFTSPHGRQLQSTRTPLHPDTRRRAQGLTALLDTPDDDEPP